jgi:3-oxoacyl-[acyl-carrier protein] reductase
MDLGIKDKVAMVAGASSGIGYAIAGALAAEGARVVIASRSEERIAAAAQQLAEETGGAVVGVALDVRDPDAGTRFVRAAHDAFVEAPQILVTNAGGPPPGPFARFDMTHFEEAVQLNFLSAVRLSRAALPGMRAERWGRIVHIISSTVHEPSVGLFLSSSVRPAVAGFSKALAREVARDGITVNVVSPGVIATARLSELAEFLAETSGRSVDEEFRAMGEAVPAGRIGAPQELAEAVAFLCSARAAYITGIALRVDGGKVSSLL